MMNTGMSSQWRVTAYQMRKAMPTTIEKRMLTAALMKRSVSLRTFCSRATVSPLLLSSYS